MGYTLYRDRTKPSESDEEMWTSPLNSYLREHHMGHAGGISVCKHFFGLQGGNVKWLHGV
ncbi:hypothetical protein ACFWP3_39200 [Streptomyces sp. NPDC058525]|uniref:hypothetical protein n=1 Tax=Streptomyces sp. NPDC058525 TaxID=3346538 RepID=UPI0036506156